MKYSGAGIESLNSSPFSDDDDATPLLNVFMNAAQPDVEDQVGAENMRQIIRDALIDLPPRESRIIEARFGLRPGDTEPEGLREIGKRFDLTRERIRPIESEALKRLARDERMRGLYNV